VINIQETCEPKFKMVREASATNFSTRGEVGAAIAIFLDGKLVVDLWEDLLTKSARGPGARRCPEGC
jgi:hypothetical protein